MPVIGVGNDLVRISRIEGVFARRGQRFARRIMPDDEYARFLAAKRPEIFLAKSFAVKEAVAKALGTGISQGVSFDSIELYKRESGQPAVRLFGAARVRLEGIGGQVVHVSLSDEADWVSAFAVVSA